MDKRSFTGSTLFINILSVSVAAAILSNVSVNAFFFHGSLILNVIEKMCMIKGKLLHTEKLMEERYPART
jgi:hypothetical protein